MNYYKFSINVTYDRKDTIGRVEGFLSAKDSTDANLIASKIAREIDGQNNNRKEIKADGLISIDANFGKSKSIVVSIAKLPKLCYSVTNNPGLVRLMNEKVQYAILKDETIRKTFDQLLKTFIIRDEDELLKYFPDTEKGTEWFLNDGLVDDDVIDYLFNHVLSDDDYKCFIYILACSVLTEEDYEMLKKC